MKYLLFILSNKSFLIHKVSSYFSELFCFWLFWIFQDTRLLISLNKNVIPFTYKELRNSVFTY